MVDPNDSRAQPMYPRQAQMGLFKHKTALYAQTHPTVLVIGDSRAAQYPKREAKFAFRVKGAAYANWSSSGARVQEVWWMVRHMATDLSLVTRILIPSFGINSLGNTEDPVEVLVHGMFGLMKDLRDRTPMAQILVTEVLDVGPVYYRAGPGTQMSDKRLAAFNAALEAGSGELYKYAPLGLTDPRDTKYYMPDQVHLTPEFYQERLNPVVQEHLAAHGDVEAG